MKISELHQILDSAGDLQKIPDRLEISPKNLGPSDVASLLILSRLYGQSTPLLLTDKIPSLEKVRNWIHHGNYAKALGHLPSIGGSNSDQLLEYGRIFSHLGQWQAAIDVSRLAQNSSELTPGNMALGYQISGNALTELGSLEEGAETLSTAIELYKASGNSYGVFLTTLLLAKNCRLAQGENVETLIQKTKTLLISQKFGFKGWLAYFRTLYLKPRTPDTTTAQSLWLAALIAKSIGDQFFSSLSELEYCRVTGQPIHEALFETQALSPRHKTLLGDPDLQSQVINWLTPKSVVDPQLPFNSPIRLVVLTQSQLVVDLKAQKVLHFSEDSPRFKILEILSRNSAPLERGQLFTSVWKLRWNQRMHGNLLVKTIQRLNSEIPNLMEKRSTLLKLNENSWVIDL